MSLRAHLFAVAGELQRLRDEGVAAVAVQDTTLQALRAVSGVACGQGGAARQRASGSAVAEAGPVVREAAARVPPPPAKPVANAPEPEPVPPPVVELPAGTKREQFDWLVNRVTADPRCIAHLRAGKKAVVGVGNLDAAIMFVGEAPGAEEEIQGEPFVGPAGQLLNKMIRTMGIERNDVYIGNIMNWRPEVRAPGGGEQIGNRPPTAEEMAYCLPFLHAQISIVKPGVLVALGATAAKGLLGADAVPTLGSVKGRWHDFAGTPLMVTYHPSYLLRSQSNRSKRSVWEDLLMVMERVGLPVTARQRAFFT